MSPITKTLLAISISLAALPGMSQEVTPMLPEQMEQMKQLFPVGRTFSGVKLPSYKENVLKTVLEAETVTRLNEITLSMTNLIVKVYSLEGKVESTIEMERAHYYLASGQLVSQTPAKINHEKFVMTGDQLGFDTATSLSTIKGNVKVVIQKASEFTGNFGMGALDGK